MKSAKPLQDQRTKRYTSEQVEKFRSSAQNVFHAPVTIIIDEEGMYAQTQGGPFIWRIHDV